MSTAVLQPLASFGLAPFVRYEPYTIPRLTRSQQQEQDAAIDSAVLDVLPVTPEEAISSVRVAELLDVSLWYVAGAAWRLSHSGQVERIERDRCRLYYRRP